MRYKLMALPLLLCAAPALAQATPNPLQPNAAPEIQRVLNDPAMADKLANTMQAMSKAILDMPVGELQAAVEGRQPTLADRRRRVRDIEPRIDRDVRQQIAQSGPMIRQSMKVLSDALPGMMQGLQQAQESIERAAANMPDPTYPKR